MLKTIIPIAIESVQTDGAAINVREGNNSVNSSITFGLRDRIQPMIRITCDYRDLNVVTGWNPANPSNQTWIGAEVSFGNGYLDRLEHRKQYKGNISRCSTSAGTFRFEVRPQRLCTRQFPRRLLETKRTLGSAIIGPVYNYFLVTKRL